MKTSSKIFLVCISLAVILNTAVLQVAAASDEIAYNSVHPVQAVVAAVVAVLVAQNVPACKYEYITIRPMICQKDVGLSL